MDHDSGRSKGYGFVSMGSASYANAAVTALDNYQFPGAMKPMSVKVADNNRQAGARPAGFPGLIHDRLTSFIVCGVLGMHCTS